MEKFDVIVIGTGAGSNVAKRCAAADKKTAIIDYHPYGGTCALRGCDPEKVLVGLVHVLTLNKHLEGKGITTSTTSSLKDLMRFKKSFTEPKISETEVGLKRADVGMYHGKAKFVSKNTIQINENILQAKKFVIANGAKPRSINIPRENFLIDSTAFLELKELLEDILFIGGGYITFEFAHIVSRFGVKVVILHRGEMPLGKFDADMVKLVIQIKLNTEAISIVKENNHFVVHAVQGGNELNFATSLVVHAAGRTADIDDMGLEKVNVSFKNNGIAVNEYMQSISNPNVYSCGDGARYYHEFQNEAYG